MGCDIHMWAEILRGYSQPEFEPEWRAVGRIFKSPWHDNKRVPVIDADNYAHNEILIEHPYDERNYDLFAILANVRNGSGFAGVDTGDGFRPISEPRGIPNDASDYYIQQTKKWWGDGHSHSWLFLHELEDYDWRGQTTKHRGMVSPEQYKIFKEKGKPDEWSAWTNRIGHRTVEWEESYYESAKDFVDTTIPALQELRQKEMVLDVRIVFFFDN